MKMYEVTSLPTGNTTVLSEARARGLFGPVEWEEIKQGCLPHLVAVELVKQDRVKHVKDLAAKVLQRHGLQASNKEGEGKNNARDGDFTINLTPTIDNPRVVEVYCQQMRHESYVSLPQVGQRVQELYNEWLQLQEGGE